MPGLFSVLYTCMCTTLRRIHPNTCMRIWTSEHRGPGNDGLSTIELGVSVELSSSSSATSTATGASCTQTFSVYTRSSIQSVQEVYLVCGTPDITLLEPTSAAV